MMSMGGSHPKLISNVVLELDQQHFDSPGEVGLGKIVHTCSGEGFRGNQGREKGVRSSSYTMGQYPAAAPCLWLRCEVLAERQ